MHLSTGESKMVRGPRLLPFAVLLIFLISLLWYTKSGNGLAYLKGHAYNSNSNSKSNPAANFKLPTPDSVKDVHNSTLGVRNPSHILLHTG